MNNPGESRSGPMLVWNGEKRLATGTTKAGEWRHREGWEKGTPDNGGEVHNMFDELPHTFWHNAMTSENVPKNIKIVFKVKRGLNSAILGLNNFQQPINFHMISIRKRMGEHPHFTKRYFNVCLILNENINDQMCTNTPDGFNNDSSNFITWCKPTENVTTVELIFRDNQYACINDLKIFYQPA